ncbi:ChaN family lipoprotein [Pontibaca salina]|uniref:ChaN family lipoprotein n=1 Tax=Pontibaca salina TaxID=2795731 RepID=A0A934HR51_9RHOB|nr:ChaN family lipoprotein [Pontibaca salina]MBI6628673.1 ChaN family lipoprotein [Pontibaca salina]
MKFVIAAALFALAAAPLRAASLDQVVSAAARADVVILGEVHDNPAHHTYQAQLVEMLQPSAVVWEMLTGVEAQMVDLALIPECDKLADQLGWAQSGWPDFAMYHPIFLAAPKARIFGAMVPRQEAKRAMEGGVAAAFGADAAAYGLTAPLPKAEQTSREELQQLVHCNALPPEMLAPMVEIQRLRDAALARAVIDALQATGGPVVVITGNGHARKDWGIPLYLKRVRPEVKVFAVGQSENEQIAGEFDAVLDSKPVERDDPCDRFRAPTPEGVE